MGLFSLAEVRSTPPAQPVDPNGHVSFTVPGGGGPPNDQQSKDINAGSLQRLVEFIPIESITLFWLAVPAVKSLTHEMGSTSKEIWDWVVYGGVTLLTPLLLMLVYLSRKAVQKDAAGIKIPFPKLKEWPWWRAFASTLAFAGWALAVPGNPFFDNNVSTMVLWVMAFLLSTLLSLIDPIILNRVLTAQNPNP